MALYDRIIDELERMWSIFKYRPISCFWEAGNKPVKCLIQDISHPVLDPNHALSKRMLQALRLEATLLAISLSDIFIMREITFRQQN
jgi:hypothetical protein